MGQLEGVQQYQNTFVVGDAHRAPPARSPSKTNATPRYSSMWHYLVSKKIHSYGLPNLEPLAEHLTALRAWCKQYLSGR